MASDLNVLFAVDAKDAVTDVASKAAAGAQRMAGLQPKQGGQQSYSRMHTMLA